ncbi:MAG: PAS domain S-box protein, partial [Chloroflexota bacterium]|nr:PAS domain S-box protein [Chloroflexota bacterium]
MNEPVNVLLIEDNPGDARLVREELKEVPSRVDIHLEWVDCLESGLERLAQNHIRAVLLDLSLPDSEGLNTLRAVLEQAPHLPVIVMTGQTDEEVGTRAVQAGAQDYLIKGQVDGRLLTRVIQYAMQRKQAEIQLADALEFNEHMLRSSPVGILTYRLTGECLSANEYAARIVGATVDQLKAQNFREIASWRSSGLLEMAEKTIATRVESAADVQMTTTFGKAIWLRAQFVVFRSAEELLMLTLVDITERKSAESALAAQEQFTRETLDALTANIAILDQTGTIVAVNRSWREFAQANGMSAQRVSEGINYLTVCETATGPSAGEASEMAAGIRAVMQGEKQSFTLEYPCHSPNEKRWFIARVTKFQEGPMRVVVAHEYITERKLAEEALRESEENYRQLFEAESDAIVLVDNETGQILQANQAACALYGYSLKQLLGIKNTDLSAEPEQTRQVTLQTPVAPDQVISIPLRWHRRKDGVIFPVEITGRFFMLQGRSVHIAAIRDVTERKHAEAALEASERRFRTWIEHSSDLVTVLDIDGTIHYQSPSSEHLLGYAPDDLLRTSALELLHPEDRELAIARFFEAMQGLEDSTFAECRVRHRDGSWRFLEMVGRTFVDEHGEMMALINSRDITERKQAEEKIVLQANLLSAVGSATIATNLQGQVIYWNAAAERLYGWTPEEAIGRLVTELTTSEQSQDQA